MNDRCKMRKNFQGPYQGNLLGCLVGPSISVIQVFSQTDEASHFRADYKALPGTIKRLTHFLANK